MALSELPGRADVTITLNSHKRVIPSLLEEAPIPSQKRLWGRDGRRSVDAGLIAIIGASLPNRETPSDEGVSS